MTVQVPEATSAPSVNLPGAFGIPSLAPVYVEGIPSDLAPAPSSASTQADSQRFWSSQVRLPGDSTPENLVISLSKSRLLNYITMDLAHFPHTMSVSWWDGESWQPARSQGNGAPITYAITGSVPVAVNSAAAMQAGINPYHFGAGHWIHQDDMIQPVTTDRLLLTGVRGTLSQGPYPVDGAGNISPYPLGVRNLDFGYRVRMLSDVPWTPRSAAVLTEREPFTTATDVHGSPVTVAIRENRASNLLQGKPWKCAPQVRRDSVVSLYVDSRTASGAAQVIDRFFINPVTNGVRLNLYFSPDPPPAGASFQAVDTPLLFPAVIAGGSQLPATDNRGIVFPAVSGWIQVANQATGTSAKQPWWTGIAAEPLFGSSDSGSHMIMDTGQIQLYFSSGTVLFALEGAIIGSWSPGSFSAGQRMIFAAGFDGKRFFAWMKGGALWLADLPSGSPVVSSFLFGEAQSGGSMPGNYRMTELVIKQEMIDVSDGIPGEFMQFAAHPGMYVAPSAGTGATTMNAITRFHSSFVLGVPGAGINPYGLVGGPGSSYEACTWIPVLRDFTLARGFIEFHPVLASVFKFEFTHLHAQHYDFFGSTSQTVNRLPPFPPWKYSPPTRHPGSDSQAIDPGLSVNLSIAPSVAFQDTPTPTPDPAPGTTLPTEAMYVTDPVPAASLVQRAGSMYNFQPWQPDPTVNKIQAAQPHSYEQSVVPQLSRMAYFVSVATLSMYRAEFTAQDDTECYVDNFDDAHNINQGSLVVSSQSPAAWTWEPGMLSTPGSVALGSAFAQVFSNVFSSTSPVRGVQIATAQSEAVQLLPDPSFADPALGTWTSVGDSPALAIATLNSQLGNMIAVTRIPGTYGWAFLEQSYPTWNIFQSTLPTWDSLQQNNSGSAYGGFAYDGPPVQLSPAGRVYAAARIFSPVALKAPLTLQILDGATGAVVAEADQSVQGGVVTEWYVGFTIGDAQVTSPPWNLVQATYPTWAVTLGATWNQIDTTNPALGNTVTAQVIQQGSTRDIWYADDLSIFEDSVIWEFSNDAGNSFYAAFEITNNPNGVLMFPPPEQGSGNQLMWRLSGYRPNVAVTSLAIRPWYSLHPMGVAPRTPAVANGPNNIPSDQYGPIGDDPRWQMWDLPVPQEWFFAQKQILALGSTTLIPPQGVAPLPPADVNLGLGSLVIQAPAAEETEVSTYTDIFSDTYEDFYGLADGSDFFTDTYSDLYDYSSLNITGTQQFATAALTGTGTLLASAQDLVVFHASTGASVGNVAGDANAVTFFTQRTGQPMKVRRLFFGSNIPSSLGGSLAAQDALIGRRVCIDIRPDGNTDPGRVESFLASCQAGGLDAEFTIWHGPDQHFSGVGDYLVILAQYVPLIRRYGYTHVFSISNSSVLTKNVLADWYPGDSLTDGISVELYPITFNPKAIKPTDFARMTGVSMNLISNFADVHGQPLGITQMGIDRGLFSESQGEVFLNYVLGIFSARKKAKKPNGDVIYDSTGIFDLTSGPQSWVNIYNEIGQNL